MTTFFEEFVTCALCGQQSQVFLLTSTNTLYGASDLDLRPPEMKRSTMFAWVQRCSWCGYCAPNIADGAPSMKEIVESDAYRQLLADPALPELARSFMCSSMIFEEFALPAPGRRASARVRGRRRRAL